jgi:hypothetical protein
MKFLMHPAVTAIGLSVLCFLGFIAPLTGRTHTWIYQNNGSVGAVFVPVLLNIGIVWLLFTLLLAIAQKPGRLRVLLWSGLFLAVPLLFVEDGIQLNQWEIPHLFGTRLVLVAFTCLCAANALWRPSFNVAFEHLQHFTHTLLAFAGMGAIALIVQTGWCFWQARNLPGSRPLHVAVAQISRATSPGKPRLIWIILDELSYQQVYERRFPSLELRAFDQLAGQSTLFTKVRPAAEFTEIAVPSLVTGLRANHIHAGADGDLIALRDPLSGEWQPYHPENTVFGDALDEGYSTAVAGWYIPYCRILAPVLDHCQWIYGWDNDRSMLSGTSIRANTLSAWLAFASWILPNGHWADRFDTRETQAHIADYRWLVAESDKLLENDAANFVLLHIPAPHPGGIYDRRTGAFTTHGASYVDNLALADQYLAHVRLLLQQRGEWDSSTIMVMGDHSWRTKLIWSSSDVWTAEDQAASQGGQFDDRPAYIVKLPYQTAPARITTPYDAVNTRALIDGLLSKRINSPADLAAFAENAPQRPIP